MTFPTFNNGDALPASDLNAIGLWLVKTQTIGTGVTSVVVNNAFNSDFQSYRIIIEAQDTNGAASHLIQLSGNTGSNYFHNGWFMSWGSAAFTAYGPVVQTSFISSANNAAGTGTTIWMDIANPNVARRKYGVIHSQAGNGSFMANIYNNSTATSTGFTLSKAGDTISGGTIRVYGYRN